jgi:hypothetical protein
MPMQPIQFSKAGKFKLRKYKDGAPSTDPVDCYFRNGAIQSIVPSFNNKTTALPDGNSDWDAAELDTGKEGSFTMNLSFMPIDLYAWLMGTTVEELVNTPMPMIDYEISIPEASPFVVTLPHVPDTTRQIILVDQDASAWVQTASISAVPTAAQYTISAAAAVFNSADAGKNVYLTCDWTALTAKSFGMPKSGSRPAMELTISDEAVGEDESTFYDVAIVVDKCKATGNINPPEQGKEPKPASITFKVLKPRGSRKAVDYKFAKIE